MASVPSLSFPGIDTIIAGVDQAVRQEDADFVTTTLRGVLCKLIQDDSIQLPEVVYQPVDGGYARRELYISEELGYSIMAMTWGPGQGTPIHDHCGMWCVEGVWCGEIEVVQYAKLDQADDLYKFEAQGAMVAGPGSAGSLIPPHEYHTIANQSSDKVAVTLHIYSGEMTTCNTFTDMGNNLYRRCPKRLTLN